MQEKIKDDTISRQAAIEALDKRFDDAPMELTTEILQLRRDLRERIPSAQPEQRWIPCSERLPEYGKTVLWCNDKGSIFTTAITYMSGISWAVGKRHRRCQVVAWMPLPEPYGGDQDG